MKQNNISTQKGRRVFSRRILFFLFLILAVIALVLGLNLKRYTDRERKQDNIEKEITTEKEKTGVRKLHKKYKDMIGWLEIKGTGFSYPVMQTGMKGHHPDDWQYYLHRDVHGGYSFYGTPFLDVRCRADSDNRIIYGHNINGRRYFGYLQNFRCFSSRRWMGKRRNTISYLFWRRINMRIITRSRVMAMKRIITGWWIKS